MTKMLEERMSKKATMMATRLSTMPRHSQADGNCHYQALDLCTVPLKGEYYLFFIFLSCISNVFVFVFRIFLNKERQHTGNGSFLDTLKRPLNSPSVCVFVSR
jgi:hypothetical protein